MQVRMQEHLPQQALSFLTQRATLTKASFFVRLKVTREQVNGLAARTLGKDSALALVTGRGSRQGG